MVKINIHTIKKYDRNSLLYIIQGNLQLNSSPPQKKQKNMALELKNSDDQPY